MKTDKILHLLFGFIIAWRLIDINAHWIIALVVVILFGVAKEVYDYGLRSKKAHLFQPLDELEFRDLYN